MSYSTQAHMAQDGALLLRVAACAASEHIPHPEQWAWSHQWELSAQPGWDAAYAYAVSLGDEMPGGNEGVVTDAMILSAVQSLRAAETAAAA